MTVTYPHFLLTNTHDTIYFNTFCVKYEQYNKKNLWTWRSLTMRVYSPNDTATIFDEYNNNIFNNSQAHKYIILNTWRS